MTLRAALNSLSTAGAAAVIRGADPEVVGLTVACTICRNFSLPLKRDSDGRSESAGAEAVPVRFPVGAATREVTARVELLEIALPLETVVLAGFVVVEPRCYGVLQPAAECYILRRFGRNARRVRAARPTSSGIGAGQPVETQYVASRRC